MISFTVYGRGDFDEVTGLMTVNVVTYSKAKKDDEFKRGSVQTLLLPKEQAHELVRTMTPTRDNMVHALDRTATAVASGDGFSHWNPPRELMPCLRWLKFLAGTMTAHLGHLTCKYMTVRIDMRGGDFVVLDDNRKRAEGELRDMIVRYTERTPSICNIDDHPHGHSSGSTPPKNSQT